MSKVKSKVKRNEITVSEMIEFLSKCKPNAIICKFESGYDEPDYISIETMIKTKTEFVNDNGDIEHGKIVVFN